jgi:hypothetical protein
MATVINGCETATELVTVEQWAAIEGPPHYELLDGSLKEKPPVAVWHDILLVRLLRKLMAIPFLVLAHCVSVSRVAGTVLSGMSQADQFLSVLRWVSSGYLCLDYCRTTAPRVLKGVRLCLLKPY